MNKARRGELECQLPIGFVHDEHGRVALAPDQQVQQSVRLVFDTFTRTGTAYATASHFRAQGLRFPTRVHGGARHGELEWRRRSFGTQSERGNLFAERHRPSANRRHRRESALDRRRRCGALSDEVLAHELFDLVLQMLDGFRGHALPVACADHALNPTRERYPAVEANSVALLEGQLAPDANAREA